MPEISELTRDVLIGTQNIEGPPATGPDQVSAPSGNSNQPAVEIREEKPKILHTAEFMPEYPGGRAAFIRFLSKHLKAPDVLQPGEKIKILIQFVVGTDGELSNIKFIQTGGEVFEQEVLRVMKKMPKWKPGMQNGQSVAVYFNLPVVFQAPEE